MIHLALAGIVIALATSAVVSLLLLLPCSALAESVAVTAARRGRIWFIGLVLPVIAGAAAAGWTLWTLRTESPLLRDSWERRKHLCVRSFFQGADATWRANVGGWSGAVLLVGGVAGMLAGAAGTERSRRRHRRAARVPSVAVCAALEDIPARYRVAESRLGELALPERNSACAGALRPEVFVTTGLVQALPRDELAAVLAHEFSHARRHDNLLGLVARSCVILAAFMPSAVYFARRWGRDSELAADEWAYEALGRPEALVRAMATAAGARQLAEPGRAAELVAAVGGGEFAAERVLRLHAVMTADPEGPSGVPASVRRLAAVLATLGVLGVTVAAWDSVDASLRCLGQSLLAALG